MRRGQVREQLLDLARDRRPDGARGTLRVLLDVQPTGFEMGVQRPGRGLAFRRDGAMTLSRRPEIRVLTP
jgi:hypothetical protein